MNVYLETDNRKLNRKNILIGGAVAGVIALICALAIANTGKKSEKRK